MRERFPADDDHVGTCGTCPWMHDGSDIQPALDAGSLSVVTAAQGAASSTSPEAARASETRRRDYSTRRLRQLGSTGLPREWRRRRLGAPPGRRGAHWHRARTTRHARLWAPSSTAMLAYPSGGAARAVPHRAALVSHLTPRTGAVITNLGMAALRSGRCCAPGPASRSNGGSSAPGSVHARRRIGGRLSAASRRPRTGARAGRSGGGAQFCVADTGNAAVNTQIRDLTALAIAAWNDALDVTAFLLTGACDPETAVARYNHLNEVFAMAPGRGALEPGSRVRQLGFVPHHHGATRPPRAPRPHPHHARRFLPHAAQNTDLTNEGLSTKNVSSDRGAGVDHHPGADLDRYPSAVDSRLTLRRNRSPRRPVHQPRRPGGATTRPGASAGLSLSRLSHWHRGELLGTPGWAYARVSQFPRAAPSHAPHWCHHEPRNGRPQNGGSSAPGSVHARRRILSAASRALQFCVADRQRTLYSGMHDAL